MISNLTAQTLFFSDEVKFYTFPSANLYPEQRLAWILAVRNSSHGSQDQGINWVPRTFDGDPLTWEPQYRSTICSAHFVGNKKSMSNKDPNWKPTIFPKLQPGLATKLILFCSLFVRNVIGLPQGQVKGEMIFPFVPLTTPFVSASDP